MKGARENKCAPVETIVKGRRPKLTCIAWSISCINLLGKMTYFALRSAFIYPVDISQMDDRRTRQTALSGFNAYPNRQLGHAQIASDG